MALLRKLAILILVGLAAPLGQVWAFASTDLEYQVKAAFLYNFAKFVEWPADMFEGDGEALVLCVAGDDPFGGSLDGVVRGETLNGRRLVVHRTRDLSEIQECHVVFVPRSERSRQERILDSVRHRGVLTVGETDGFLTGGGIIRFVLDQNKVRFDVNLEAAESSGLKLSSKLLRLARMVYGSQQGKGGMP